MRPDGTSSEANLGHTPVEAASETTNESSAENTESLEQQQHDCSVQDAAPSEEQAGDRGHLTAEFVEAEVRAPDNGESNCEASDAAAASAAASMGDEDRETGIPESEGSTESDYLEEVLLPPRAPVDMNQLEAGSTVAWGEHLCTVVRPLPYGWYEALDQDENGVLLRPGMSPFAGLRSHPILPTILYSGPEGHIILATPGEAIRPEVSVLEAFAVLIPLAQLVRFFEAQGFAVVDLDPDAIVDTVDGLRLQRTPRLARIGENLPQTYGRDGFSPPEAQSGQVATGREGVYVLGALLYYLLTGCTVPSEGLSSIALTGLGRPGLPQLLSRATKQDYRSRFAPQELAVALKSLQGDNKQVRYGIAAATTIGLNPERFVNEDSLGYTQNYIETAGGTQQHVRACVADGMGGEEAGEVASQAAVDAFCGGHSTQPASTSEEQAEWTELLGWAANQAVLGALQGQSGGCTLTGVVIQGDRLTLAHVGDSRAYLYQPSGLERLTRDHSLVSALLASGVITEEEARTSPDRSKILRSLGSVRAKQPHYIDQLTDSHHEASITLHSGDVLILCTDGVCGELEEAQIEEVVRTSRTPDDIASELIRRVIEQGAPDNATALVIVCH